MMISRLLKALRRRLLPSKEYVVHSGSVIPARHRRCCGPEFRDDSFYVESTRAEAKRLVDRFGCDSKKRILDVGCGQGRLPIGILRVIGEVAYTGIDVDKDSIEWCRRHIEQRHPSFRFYHLDVANERYNRRGNDLGSDFTFDFADMALDIIYLFSVFSHMSREHMKIYLSDFRRLLDDGGGLFFTAFVEEGVPPVSTNPAGYALKKFSGPLHVVRYDKDHLFDLIDRAGFNIDGFNHRTETDGQSAVYLSKQPRMQA